MARQVWFGAAMLVATLCLASCDVGSAQGGGSSSTASADTGSGTGPPTGGTDGGSGGGDSGGGGNGGGGSGGGGGGGDDGFSYTPWGPDDPPIPGQYAAFAATSSQDLDCNRVEGQKPDGEFWDTALAVCHAIRDDAAWPDTTTVPDPPDPENDYQRCLNGELATMLQQALRWHADNPGRRPEISYPSSSTTSPCQATLYEVRVLTVVEAESLDLGYEGKIAVVVLAPPGRSGELEVTVTVDGQQSGADDAVDNGDRGVGLSEVVVFLEPASQPRTATIEVSNGRGTMTGSVDLPGVGGSAPPSATESPTPPDQTGEQTGEQTGSASESASPDG